MIECKVLKKDIFLIDMDDTLFDFKRTEEINLIKTLKNYGITADKHVWQRFHQINLELWQKFERGEITKSDIKTRRFGVLFEEFGYSADLNGVADYFFESFKDICIPLDGAKEFLTELNRQGRVYFVTNGNTVCQNRHIEDAGFLPLIAGAFISDEIGYNKPSAEYAKFVKAHINGFEDKRAVWIGDSLTSDCECARRAGIDFILFAPDGKPDEYSGLYAENHNEILKILNL